MWIWLKLQSLTQMLEHFAPLAPSVFKGEEVRKRRALSSRCTPASAPTDYDEDCSYISVSKCLFRLAESGALSRDPGMILSRGVRFFFFFEILYLNVFIMRRIIFDWHTIMIWGSITLLYELSFMHQGRAPTQPSVCIGITRSHWLDPEGGRGTPTWKGRGCSSEIFVLNPKRYHSRRYWSPF